MNKQFLILTVLSGLFYLPTSAMLKNELALANHLISKSCKKHTLVAKKDKNLAHTLFSTRTEQNNKKKSEEMKYVIGGCLAMGAVTMGAVSLHFGSHSLFFLYDLFLHAQHAVDTSIPAYVNAPSNGLAIDLVGATSTTACTATFGVASAYCIKTFKHLAQSDTSEIETIIKKETIS